MPDAMALAAVFYTALGAACVLIVAAIVLAGSGGMLSDGAAAPL